MKWVTTEPPGRKVVAIDFETTGLNYQGRDRIVQLGLVVAVKKKITYQWSEYLNPDGVALSPKAAQVNGLTDEMLSSVETRFSDVADRLAAVTEGALVISHRLPFDQGFWAAECDRAGLVAPERAGMCTRVLAWVFSNGKAPSLRHALPWYGIPTADLDMAAHDALNDAKACMRLYQYFNRNPVYGKYLRENHDNNIIGGLMKTDWPTLSADEYDVYRAAATEPDLTGKELLTDAQIGEVTASSQAPSFKFPTRKRRGWFR